MGPLTTTEVTMEQEQSSLAEPLLPPQQLQPVVPHAQLIRLDDRTGNTGNAHQQEEQQEEYEDSFNNSVSFVDPARTLLSIDESSWNHGEEQPVHFRNIFFAILFLAQLVAVLTLSIMAIVAWSKDDDFIISPIHIHWIWDHESTSTATSMLLFGIAMLGCTAALSAIVILFLLTTFADMMIQVSLVLPPISCGLSSLGALMLGQVGPSLLLLLMCVMGIWYAKSVWHRIPFATANVAVAMAAIHAHKGVLGLAYSTLVQAILWTILWTLAVVEVSILQNDRRCDDSSSSSDNQNEYDVLAENINSRPLDCIDSTTVSTQEKWVLLGLFLSLYWTSEVIRNVLHTTIAGVVGTFWFVGAPTTTTTPTAITPANDHHTTIFDSWLRSSVYSFGSICLGSLLVAVVQVLQLLVRLGRHQREQQQQQRRHGREQVLDASSMLWCVLECAVDYLERLLEYINSWAFVYIGLYGYEYWTAGQKVYQLFVARGWSLILNDHLVSRSLRMMKLFIGILSGALTVVLGLVWFGWTMNPLFSFLVGGVLGTFMADIQLQVVTSAVETIVVCFAEAPSALMDENHHPPELGDRMMQAWRTAYPDECGF